MKQVKKKTILFTTVIAIAMFFITAGIYAANKVPDTITMNNGIYKKHKKSLVEFTHKTHVEYTKDNCGTCHHDKDGKPIKGLKAGDKVQDCAECHAIPGRKPRKSKDDKMKFHAEAMHKACKDCHKKYNKKNKLKSKDKGYAPMSCKQCHPKK